MTAAAPAETHQFQAETARLLDLMIHSLYTNKEIFLRELISNASDALDKVHFESLTDADLLAGDTELQIRLEADPEARTLTISDNGIGMSREEVANNIGTIAKSGTRELLAKLKESGAADQPTDQWEVFQCVIQRRRIVSRRARYRNAREKLDRGEQVLEFAFEHVLLAEVRCEELKG